jgi:hypothetical protein
MCKASSASEWLAISFSLREKRKEDGKKSERKNKEESKEKWGGSPRRPPVL